MGRSPVFEMLLLACLVTLSRAAEFQNDMLTVDGKPFFALTGWGDRLRNWSCSA